MKKQLDKISKGLRDKKALELAEEKRKRRRKRNRQIAGRKP